MWNAAARKPPENDPLLGSNSLEANAQEPTDHVKPFDMFGETISFPGISDEDLELEPDQEPEVQYEPFPELPEVQIIPLGSGEAAWFSMKSPAKETANEDSVAALPIHNQQGLLVVADGLGGHRGGRLASQNMVKYMSRCANRMTDRAVTGPLEISGAVDVPGSAPKPFDARSEILDHIEKANLRLLRNGSGAATTLALVEINGHKVRSYHVGDSEILIVSQRGRVKYETVSHSPVGYAVQAGLLSEDEALMHEERHLISNVVGSEFMTIEMGGWIKLAARDTVLLASDGLFDNLKKSEIIDLIRIGRLEESVRKLATLAVERMVVPTDDMPSKADDLTILAFRRSRPTPRSTSAT